MNYYSDAVSENKYIDYLFKFIVDIIVVVMLALFFVTTIASKNTVEGNSMSPTLNSNDEMLINELSFGIFSPDRNDVVAFEVNNQYYIKRIIGLPGETIQIVDGYIYINGSIYNEEQTFEEIVSPGLGADEIVLGENEYFVLGDNRNNSEDSRFSYIGNLKKNEIIGKVWFKLTPLSEIGFIE